MVVGERGSNRKLDAVVFLVALCGTMGGIWGGPALGDHEAIVAQCARNMRISGDWIVPRYRESNFLRKPPLGYWLVAASSYIFGNDPATGLPVTQTAARFPSALAALGTVLLLWKLGSSMFHPRIGRVTAIVASASVLILLFAPNATVEMLLTFCCTWAFTHFWFATIKGYRTPGGMLHMFLYYIALGTGMMAKGPAPLAMVAVPIAVWWFTEAGFGVLARGGRHCFRNAALIFVRRIPRQILRAFTQLWVIPGIFVFLAVFVPWMWAAASRNSYALELWDWQYFQRFQGDYEDTKVRGVLYFVPIALGLLVPWTFSFFEGMASPFLGLSPGRRRAFYYAATWGCVGVAVMSVMTFKKPYYIVPAMPGLVLITSVAVDRFFRSPPKARWLAGGVVALMAIGIAYGVFRIHKYIGENFPATVNVLTVIAGACGALILVAAILHVARRGWWSMATLSAAMIGGFLTVWNVAGAALDNVDDVAALDRELNAAQVPRDAIIYWADQRPDARLEFYFGRRSAHLVDPSELVQRWVDRTTLEAKTEMLGTVVERLKKAFAGPEPVYVLLNRRRLWWLDQEPSLKDHTRTLCVVDVDAKPDDHDWFILTNSRS